MTRITAELTTGMEVRLSNGRHQWNGDEPLDAGGTDTGPNPYELLMGALAACTCVTIAAYCRFKKLPLRSINATYDFSRIHADDCKDCEIPDRGFIENVESNVRIEGDFDDAQKKRLAQIVTRCPVHKTLANGVEIEDNTTFASSPLTADTHSSPS